MLEIIGQSRALKEVFEQIEMVADTDATVLILGETGCGKELIAKAIHNRSARLDKPFVKVNCSAIPGELLESELFGHERGAFTNAFAQRIGRFETADKGTLFLDEIGDIALSLQPKLLRVLQEREFERVGGSRTIKVNVRLIAATHRDLFEMVADREFRCDLLYRLNVFPIRVPPLRDRLEDIPLLVHFFARKYAECMRRDIVTIPASTIRSLEQWHWPGNVRELENFIARSVILSPSSSVLFMNSRLYAARRALQSGQWLNLPVPTSLIRSPKRRACSAVEMERPSASVLSARHCRAACESSASRGMIGIRPIPQTKHSIVDVCFPWCKVEAKRIHAVAEGMRPDFPIFLL